MSAPRCSNPCPQRHVKVEALVDAEAGMAETREPGRDGSIGSILAMLAGSYTMVTNADDKVTLKL